MNMKKVKKLVRMILEDADLIEHHPDLTPADVDLLEQFTNAGDTTAYAIECIERGDTVEAIKVLKRP